MNSNSESSAKAKLTLGYDNNVSDNAESILKSRFYQLYVNSNISFPKEKSTFLMKLQNGIKYLDDSAINYESILVNDLSTCFSYRILAWLMPEVSSEIKGRTSIHNISNISPSEEPYLRGSADLALKTVIYGDIAGKIYCSIGAVNFEDFDIYDSRNSKIGLKADIRLLPDTTMGVSYSYESINFSKWNEEQLIRKDKLGNLTVSIQSYRNLLIDFAYSYQSDKSNMKRFSNKSNRFAILLAKSLPDNFVIQTYAVLRLEKYETPSEDTDISQFDLFDDERSVIAFRLSKDINDLCTLEVEYDLRSKRSVENGSYTKGVISASVLFNF